MKLKPSIYKDVLKFFRLVADSGRFSINQLYVYINHRLPGETILTGEERLAVEAYARSKGAKREKGTIAPIYTIPVKRRRPLPKGKADKLTIDMFGGR